MKKIIFAALAAAAVGTASATYKVDEYHANVRFAIDHFTGRMKLSISYAV